MISAREVGAIDNSSYRDINRGVDTLTASKHLRRLCDFNLLQKKGQGSGTYYLPTGKLLARWKEIQTKEVAPIPSEFETKPSEFDPKPSEFETKPSEFASKPSEFETKPSEFASKPSEFETDREPPVDLAAEIQMLGKRAKEEMIRDFVRKQGAWIDLSLPVLARLLGRSEVYLRQRIVSPMVKEGLLQFTIPEEANHPRQKYRVAPPA